MAIRFARVSGWIFFILGILGFFIKTLFGMIQFDITQNIIHLILGILGLAAAANQKAFLYTVLVSAALIILGIIGFFVSSWMGMNLEAMENILYLLLGIWGLYIMVYRKA